MCGALNSNLFRVAAQFDPATTVFITAGKQGGAVRRPHWPAAGCGVRVSGTRRDLPKRRPIANFARDLFLKGEVDQVKVVATLFVNTLTQQTAVLEFLPIGEIKGLKIPGAESEADSGLQHIRFPL